MIASDDTRSDGELAFDFICRQADLESAVANMTGSELRHLNAYLHFLPDSGVPALVRALVREAAADKFLNAPND